MILLKANRELDEVFERLIHTMKVNVKWDGIFAVVGNYLILLGEVRSLFFNFENRKVVTNIIDIPVKEEDVVTIGKGKLLPNTLNMVLYAFGKWGSIHVKVEQNYAQLDELFTDILREIHVQPDFNEVNYRFYKEGIRLTYEDVIQLAIEAGEDKEKEENEADEETLGLWHKICWKKRMLSFEKQETTAEERISDRLGNNFYLVGYHCPSCGEKLHMVVYPVNHELLVETEEGRVYLARAYTCDNCNSFYTPRPEKLLAEGDVYELQFEDDTKAYEDYLELLGRTGERTSNYKFNEFEADRKKKKSDDASQSDQKETEKLEKLAENLEQMSDAEIQKLSGKIEEGFFSPETLKRWKAKNGINWWKRLQKGEETKQKKSLDNTTGKTGNVASSGLLDLKGQTKSMPEERVGNQGSYKNAETGYVLPASEKSDKSENVITPERAEKLREKYDARMKVLPRMSDYQLKELIQQLKKEKELPAEEKSVYLAQVEESQKKKRFDTLKKKTENCEQKNYAQISRIVEEIEKEPLPADKKASLLEPLLTLKKEKADAEVRQLAKELSGKMDRRQYKALRQKMNSYPEVDISPYTKEFDEAFEKAEKQEIANIVNRARKISRDDYTELLNRLGKQDFNAGLLKPYEEKIVERIAEIDKKKLDELCPGRDMSFAEGIAAYERIENGIFLPELKVDALKMLDKRLRKLKADECELLIKKLQDIFQGKLKENPRIHYYPARKILMGNADAEEKERFDTAMTIFAADRNRYEEPIVLFDTSKAGDGREGVMLSADHIFYGSRFDAGTIPVLSITGISAKNGLLNRGLYISQKNGAKTKLHYVVDNNEAMMLAESLWEFIGYLQEKPESRTIPYLAKEKHEVICCLRCGYIYKEGNVCPKCGYKVNN